MLSMKLLLRASVTSQRAYCVSKIRPPHLPRDVPWTPYDHIIRDKDSEYIEDVMEFRSESEQPFQRMRGKKNLLSGMFELLHRLFSASSPLKNEMKRRERAFAVEDQLYNPERVKALGPELAVAHFVCARGGGVKFVGKDGFVQPGRNLAHTVLPGYRDDSFKVEAINAVNFNFIYEGLLMLSELESLRWISFKGNTLFDNWCVDRLSLVAPHLEFINFDGCTKIDHHAFACFYRFRKLQCVCVENTNQTDEFKLACLTLESQYPNLVFVGLDLKRPKKSVFNTK